PFDGVLVGSGDRENPLDKASRSSASASGGSADDYFFLIKDRNVLPGTGADLNRSFSELTDISTNTCLIRNSPVACDVNVDLGWKLKLQLGTGEKVLATATTFGNTVFFTSYLPPKSSAAATCGPGEGSGALYAVSLDDGAAAFDFNKSDNVPGDTTGDSNSLADRIDALASGGIPAQVVFIPAGSTGLSYIRPDLNIDTPPVSNRYRTFWQRLEQ
ncbi:MAG TPA: hypothetical protein VLI06_13190, partial [Solimonas sp.]|nr:hypothetical protein [Solimonas sp.]